MTGGVGRICELNAASQYISRMPAGKLATVLLVDRLDVQAVDVPQFMNVAGPSRPDVRYRRTASSAGSNQLAQRPGIAPSRGDGANVFALIDVEGDAAPALGG
jgi:hypothetical protein